MSWRKMLTAAFFLLLTACAKYKNSLDVPVRIVPVFRYKHAFHASFLRDDRMNASFRYVLSGYKTTIYFHFYALCCKNPFYYYHSFGTP